MPNIRTLLRRFTGAKPATLPAEQFKQGISDKEKELIRKFGVTVVELNKVLERLLQVNLERSALYGECEKALQHWMVAAAVEVYADAATQFNQLQNATVWVTAENSKYMTELEKLFDRIGLEEKIFDWAYTLAAYGDLFVKPVAHPGLGIIAVEDDLHPLNVSRADYLGRLLGFYKTPQGVVSSVVKERLLPPWEYVHFRLLGIKKKRPLYSDQMFAEFKTVQLLSPDAKRITGNYGSPIIINALPVYKRLRLAEDALLMARLTRGILRYIYKVKVSGENVEAVAEIIDQYEEILKRARAIDLENPNFESKFSPLSAIEDIILPVWGDVNDLAIDKIGGDADIKWIVDIEELRNQLSAALRVPLQVLGGYGAELKAGLGESALERLDIRFARACRRLQRSIIEGVKRLCQIHLAYMGMDPDLNLFDIHMSETSSAEEEELKSALEKGVDIVQKAVDLIVSNVEGVDKVELINYFNQKVLKLGDLDLNKLKKGVAPVPEEKPIERRKILYESNGILNGRQEPMKVASDLKALLPNEKEVWEKYYRDSEVIMERKEG